MVHIVPLSGGRHRDHQPATTKQCYHVHVRTVTDAGGLKQDIGAHSQIEAMFYKSLITARKVEEDKEKEETS